MKGQKHPDTELLQLKKSNKRCCDSHYLLPYPFHTSTNAATWKWSPSYSQSVCLVFSPLIKKHSNFISATTSSRKSDWNKHCTAQLKNFLGFSARTHWTTELHDQPTVLWTSAASREQDKPYSVGSARISSLDSWLFLIHLSLRKYTMGSPDLAVHANLELCSGFALVGSIWGQTCLCLPPEMIFKLQIHFYAGCITYFSKEEHGFITWQICSTFSTARRVVTWTNLFTRFFWGTDDEYKFGEL